MSEKDIVSPDLKYVPDGGAIIKEVNNKKLNYNIQINDSKYWQYHRNNGISKIGYHDNLSGTTKYIFRVIEGQV